MNNKNKYTHKKNQYGFYKPGDLVVCMVRQMDVDWWNTEVSPYEIGDIGIVVCEVEEKIPSNYNVFNGIPVSGSRKEVSSGVHDKYYPTIQVMWHRTGKKSVIEKQHVKSVPKIEKVTKRIN